MDDALWIQHFLEHAKHIGRGEASVRLDLYLDEEQHDEIVEALKISQEAREALDFTLGNYIASALQRNPDVEENISTSSYSLINRNIHIRLPNVRIGQIEHWVAHVFVPLAPYCDDPSEVDCIVVGAGHVIQWHWRVCQGEVRFATATPVYKQIRLTHYGLRQENLLQATRRQLTEGFEENEHFHDAVSRRGRRQE